MFFPAVLSIQKIFFGGGGFTVQEIPFLLVNLCANLVNVGVFAQRCSETEDLQQSFSPGLLRAMTIEQLWNSPSPPLPPFLWRSHQVRAANGFSCARIALNMPSVDKFHVKVGVAASKRSVSPPVSFLGQRLHQFL